jgi:hypothetical protein
MPFVSREELDRLHADSQRAYEYDQMGSIIELAKSLRTELVGVMTEQPYATTADIGRIAYERVLEEEIEAARDEVVVAYEQQYRATLYQQVIDKVEAEEGEAILSSVRNRIDTDPELAVELRESARKELSARAMKTVKREITSEQELIIDSEAERQIALDRLDVEFLVDGELDLLRDDVNQLLQPNDRLVLFLQDPSRYSKGDAEITLEWTVDVNGRVGWAFVHANTSLYSKDGYEKTLPSDKFIEVGSSLRDMVEGSRSNVVNHLQKGEPIALMVKGSSGALKLLPTFQQAPYYEMKPSVLTKIDFRTKTLDFSEQAIA